MLLSGLHSRIINPILYHSQWGWINCENGGETIMSINRWSENINIKWMENINKWIRSMNEISEIQLLLVKFYVLSKLLRDCEQQRACEVDQRIGHAWTKTCPERLPKKFGFFQNRLFTQNVPSFRRTLFPCNPCKECGKNVRSNQDAILCVECNLWSHAKCLNLTKAAFKYYLDNPNIDWTCSWCSLPFRTVDYSFEVEKDHDELNKTANSSINTSNGGHANENPPNSQWSSILEERKNNSSGAFIMHLNVNSIQN